MIIRMIITIDLISRISLGESLVDAGYIWVEDPEGTEYDKYSIKLEKIETLEKINIYLQ